MFQYPWVDADGYPRHPPPRKPDLSLIHHGDVVTAVREYCSLLVDDGREPVLTAFGYPCSPSMLEGCNTTHLEILYAAKHISERLLEHFAEPGVPSGPEWLGIAAAVASDQRYVDTLLAFSVGCPYIGPIDSAAIDDPTHMLNVIDALRRPLRRGYLLHDEDAPDAYDAVPSQSHSPDWVRVMIMGPFGIICQLAAPGPNPLFRAVRRSPWLGAFLRLCARLGGEAPRSEEARSDEHDIVVAMAWDFLWRLAATDPSTTRDVAAALATDEAALAAVARARRKRLAGKKLKRNASGRGRAIFFVASFVDRDRGAAPVRCCLHCGDEANNRCARCRDAYFCSKDCQVAIWRFHKLSCSPKPSPADGGAGMGSEAAGESDATVEP